MALAPGTHIGSYEILAPLGAGGMGEVYRAKDIRLAREVAIKVLPRELSSDPERLRRFEAEARSASALNHPNIITIYEIGQVDSIPYISMELVEGKTLRESLRSGPLPLKKLLQVATQVAAGLAKAHEVGITHRDLKPENIMIDRDGLVKILDFGLAKLARPEPDSAVQRQAPTIDPPTRPGVLVGTVGYMSPQQASGQPVDYRSDQFSFGSILYEMATGVRAFRRETAVETMAAIIREEPKSITAMNPSVPAPLRWPIERCLAKDPGERYASTRDLAAELRILADRVQELVHAEVPEAAQKIRWPLAPSIALLVVAGLALSSVVSYYAGKGTGKTDSSLPSFKRLSFRRGNITNARFFPDGHTIVYSAAWDGKLIQIFTQQIEGPESAPLALPSAGILSVSSSGEMAISLGCILNWGDCMGTLARFKAGGGAARPILEDVDGADWGPDGTFAVLRRLAEKHRLEFPSGNLLYESPGWITNIRVSPKGDQVAFIDHPILGDLRGSVAVVDRAGHKKNLLPEWRNMQGLAWSPDGNEIWFSGSLTPAAANLHGLSLSGRVRGIVNTPPWAIVQDISRDGRSVLLVVSNTASQVKLAASDRTQEQDLSWFDWSTAADLSADGKTLLFYEWGVATGNHVVFLRKTDGSDPIRLGDGKALALSPDGKWALALQMTSPQQLILLPTGPGEQRQLPRDTIEEYSYAMWFPDTQKIAFTGKEAGHRQRSYVQDTAGGKPRPLTEEDTVVVLISHDGTRVVVLSPDGYQLRRLDGGSAVRIRNLEAPDDVPIQWSSDGRYLYVRAPGDFIATVDRLDLSTGRREHWKILSPSDPAGVIGIQVEPHGVLLTPDGKSCVYTYWRTLDQLYLAERLK